MLITSVGELARKVSDVWHPQSRLRLTENGADIQHVINIQDKS